jgi:hypothetical protein
MFDFILSYFRKNFADPDNIILQSVLSKMQGHYKLVDSITDKTMENSQIDYDSSNMLRINYSNIEFCLLEDQSRKFFGLMITMVVWASETSFSVYSTERSIKTNMHKIFQELKIDTEELFQKIREKKVFDGLLEGV